MRSSITIIAAYLACAIAAPIGTVTAAETLFAGGLTVRPGELGFETNLLANPGFDTPSSSNPTKPVSWSTTPALTLDSTVLVSGTYSYKLTAALNTGWRNHVTQQVTVQPGVYRASGWIKTNAFGDGTSSGARLGFAGKHAALVGGTREWTYVEVDNINVVSAGTYTFILDQYGTPVPGGEAWYDEMRLERKQPQLLDVFMLYPNYRGMLFDDQPDTIRLDVVVAPPPGTTLADYTVVLRLKEEVSGLEVAVAQYPAPPARFTASISGAAMVWGTPYRVEVALLRTDGTTAYVFPEFRVSRVSAARRATMAVAFDDRNRVLLNGTPKFVLGLYDSGGGYNTADSYWENQIWSPTGARRLEGVRFNMYLNYWLGQMPADATAALLANLQRRGVFYLQTYNCFSNKSASATAFSAMNDGYVLDYGSRAGAAGYYTIDECVPEMISEAFANLQRLKSLDPDSATFAALYPRNDVPMFREAADILSTDPYPLYGPEPASGYPHGNVARDTIRTRDAVQDARPFFTVLQFFKFTSDSRFPTLAEMRAHATMSIVEGAKGLFWWSVGTGGLQNEPEPSRSEQLAKLKAVVNELADLEPVLLAPANPAALAGNSNAVIKTLVKVVGSRGYVFAYNSTNATQSATFTWSTTPQPIVVNAEARSLPVAGSSFSDSFGPFAAHIYVIETTPPNTAPVAEATSGVTSAATPVTITLRGRDAEQCELTFQTVTAPTNGAVSGITDVACVAGAPNSDAATIVYTPAAGFTGSDQFTYRVSDGALASAVATVSITVQAPPNTAPVADPINVTTTAGTPVTITLRGGDTEQCELTFQTVAAPTNGTVNGITNVACVAGAPNSDTATIVYTPAAGFSGSDQFTYGVNDGALTSAAATVSITVQAPPNTAPVADPISVTTTAGTPVTITLRGRDAEQCELGFEIVTPPTKGTLSGLANVGCVAGAPNVDSATIVYSPAAGFSGSDAFTYRVTDGNLASGPVTVPITVSAPSPPPVMPAMYVSALAFDTRMRGTRHEERIVATVRTASGPVGNATVTIEVFNGSGSLVATFRGVTGTDGVFRTDWLKGLTNGTYVAEVAALTANGLRWDQTKGPAGVTDLDGDGRPDASHKIPH